MSKSSGTKRAGGEARREAEPAPSGSRRATAEGTMRHRDRHAAATPFASDFYRPLAGGVHVSSVGIGTHLGDCTDDDDAVATAVLAHALRRGINLVDTAINYRCQRAERCVGRAVAAEIAAGRLARDEIVVCTKGGYLPLDGAPPPTREGYQGYVRETYLDTGILAPGELVGGAHALAPAFIIDQIARSRANLGLETIDLYLLHNPEQQLDAVQPARFRTMMRHAFTTLEAQVAAGTIGAYGVATWQGARTPPEGKGHLSLHELVAIARDAGGEDHRFRVVQMPINLAMPEAIRVPTQRLGGRRTVPALQAATELGLSVIACASLMQGRLATGLPADVRAAMREVFPELATDAQRSIAFARTLPGVTAALVGTMRVDHLEEDLGAGLR